MSAQLEYIPAGLYNVDYYGKWPAPTCDEFATARIDGVCTDLQAVADQVVDDSASSGPCPVFHKALGGPAGVSCIGTNTTFTTAMPGEWSLGTENVQFAPLFPRKACH